MRASATQLGKFRKVIEVTSMPTSVVLDSRGDRFLLIPIHWLIVPNTMHHYSVVVDFLEKKCLNSKSIKFIPSID